MGISCRVVAAAAPFSEVQRRLCHILGDHTYLFCGRSKLCRSRSCSTPARYLGSERESWLGPFHLAGKTGRSSSLDDVLLPLVVYKARAGSTNGLLGKL